MIIGCQFLDLHRFPRVGVPGVEGYRTWPRGFPWGDRCSASVPSRPWCPSSWPPSGGFSGCWACREDDLPAWSPSRGCCYSYRRAPGSTFAPVWGCVSSRRRWVNLQGGISSSDVVHIKLWRFIHKVMMRNTN